MNGSRQLRPRQLKLGAFMRPVGIHTAWWRYPGAYPDANFNLQHLIRFAQKLEQGRFDAWFMADHLAVLNMPMAALKRSATVTSFDPLTLLPALAVMTEHLGLIATASTTFEPPYLIARRFASLDHISGGRAGWNLVTTSNPDSALNFGLTEHMEHGERYRRAREFYDVVTGLWDSWAEDAFVRDVEEGIYFDPDRMHLLDHQGEFLSVRGPLNIARPIQGWPVMVQAGASEAGRQPGGETAEMVRQRRQFDAQTRADIKGRSQGGRAQPGPRANHRGLSRRGRRHGRGGAGEAGVNDSRCIVAASPPCRSRSATTRAIQLVRRCPISQYLEGGRDASSRAGV
jgi:FMN-dependent oxidoreductase (nitrilotriacetate monooxygenase family)